MMRKFTAVNNGDLGLGELVNADLCGGNSPVIRRRRSFFVPRRLFVQFLDLIESNNTF